MTTTVGLWGRLSNPHDTLESVAEQGFRDAQADGQRAQMTQERLSHRPAAEGPNNRGQHFKPCLQGVQRTRRGRLPHAGRSSRRPGPVVQRRLTSSELQAVMAGYQSGRSSKELAEEFGVHHRTVADHLERLGIARRVNHPKLSAAESRRHPIPSWRVAGHRGQRVEHRCVNRSASSQTRRRPDPATACVIPPGFDAGGQRARSSCGLRPEL